MKKFLMIDIGAGTMDILYYDLESDLHYKAVVQSPTRHLASKINKLTGPILITGNEMGGGPLSSVIKQKSAKSEIIMSYSAAATIHHDLDKVKSFGINVVDEKTADILRQNGKYHLFNIQDLEIDRLETIIESFGVPFIFDAVGICAQDHGVPPKGQSHLDFRHNKFKEKLNKNPTPHSLLYPARKIPKEMNRLKSIAKSAEKLPSKEVYIMDSGMAAILGASMDSTLKSKEKKIILDIATSHTVCAALENDEIAGFFEFHTHDITLEKLEQMVQSLADGQLRHKKVLQQGGHGAYIRHSIGLNSVDTILATGPKRKLIFTSKLPFSLGAPLGDNMMTGTVGLLEAIRRQKGMDPILYL